jgi:hypothetical protein
LAAEWHSEYEELCALAPSGELAEEEWSRLRQHLSVCESCQVALEEHQRIAAEIMPVIGGAMESELDDKASAKPFDVEAGERRLMEELESNQTESGKRKEKPRWPNKGLMFAAALAIIVGSWAVQHYSFHEKTATSHIVVPPAVAIQTQAASPPSAPDAKLQLTIKRDQDEIATLRRRLQEESEQRDVSKREIEHLSMLLQGEQEARSQLHSQQERLNEQLIATQAEGKALRDKAADSAVTQTQLANLQEQMEDLHVALGDKDRNLSENAELLSHDRDIRDLIGARNLLITEIYDVAQTGARSKPFGRIFYTKDKSLIFYGYDLDKQPGLKKSVVFQAWGSSSDSGQDVNLGLFYQDDSKKQWVLKFNDARTLARLNTVFVTVEPEGGSVKPTGKPLLTASLRLEPNHP